MLEAVGFATLQHKTSKKLAFYMLELAERKRITPDQASTFKKQVIRHGGDKNNFFIHVDPAYTLEVLRKEKKEAAKPREKSAKRKRSPDEDESEDAIVEAPKQAAAESPKPAPKQQSKAPFKKSQKPTEPPKKKRKYKDWE
jgi:hypothetical protein